MWEKLFGNLGERGYLIAKTNPSACPPGPRTWPRVVLMLYMHCRYCDLLFGQVFLVGQTLGFHMLSYTLLETGDWWEGTRVCQSRESSRVPVLRVGSTQSRTSRTHPGHWQWQSQRWGLTLILLKQQLPTTRWQAKTNYSTGLPWV